MAQLTSFSHLVSRLPIAVITGFLGSGKTTLLNNLLQHPELKNSAVVVNEFGAISIDHFLVNSATEDVIIMDNGCLCCTIKGDLVKTLQTLFTKRTCHQIPEFDRVIIETTGLADPAPIIHTLLDDPILQTYYRLDSVVTTVDCVYGLSQLDQHYETIKQAAVADRLILTKSDIAESTEVEALKQRLQQLNPAALLLTTINGHIEQVNDLFHTGLYNPETKSIDVQQWLQAEAYNTNNINTQQIHFLKKPNFPLETQQDRYIQSFCVEYDEPLSWTVLNRWFQQLTALRGKDLLRIKGIVHTKESDLPIIVQGVQHIFQPPTTLPTWPSKTKKTQLVFITRNIEKKVLERMLEIIVNSQTYVEACAATLVLLGKE